jgi:hypothetical protein
LLVEVSCGAGISLLYDNDLYEKYSEKLGNNILVIVCGGNIINLEYLEELKKKFF